MYLGKETKYMYSVIGMQKSLHSIQGVESVGHQQGKKNLHYCHLVS